MLSISIILLRLKVLKVRTLSRLRGEGVLEGREVEAEVMDEEMFEVEDEEMLAGTEILEVVVVHLEV